MQTKLPILVLLALALTAFAANSILARAALTATAVDPVSFTAMRIVSGALMLWLIVRLRPGSAAGRGSWASALALFAFAADSVLAELLSLRLVMAGIAVLGGIGL